MSPSRKLAWDGKRIRVRVIIMSYQTSSGDLGENSDKRNKFRGSGPTWARNFIEGSRLRFFLVVLLRAPYEVMNFEQLHLPIQYGVLHGKWSCAFPSGRSASTRLLAPLGLDRDPCRASWSIEVFHVLIPISSLQGFPHALRLPSLLNLRRMLPASTTYRLDRIQITHSH